MLNNVKGTGEKNVVAKTTKALPVEFCFVNISSSSPSAVPETGNLGDHRDSLWHANRTIQHAILWRSLSEGSNH